MKSFLIRSGYFSCLCFAAQALLIGQTVTDRQAGRLLDQAAWGPTDAAILQVQSKGVSPWIDDQFAAAPSDIPDQALLNAAGNTNTDLTPVRAAFFQNAVNGSDQLRQRVAFLLSQLWVISQASGVSPAYAYPVYWRVLRDNSFTTYPALIKAVTLNPAMGRYLNMANNNKATATTSANENYGRELMQLFTLGTVKLNADGSQVIGTGGTPVATYTEDDVRDLAKALTGWTYPTAPGATAKANNPDYYFGAMIATEANHDKTAKVVLGVTIPAGQTASQDLDSVIAILMQQSTMAPFVCRQLIEHLVTSNPSPQYIARISAVFGTQGDLKAVIKAILTDPEARLGDTTFSGASFGHLREPILLFANLARGMNSSVDATNTLGNFASALGENLFVPASVFSYFSPFARTEKGLYGPEFQIYSTQTAPARSNYIYSFLYGTSGTNGALGTTKPDFTVYNAKDADLTKLVDYINYVFLYHSASADLVSNALAAAKGAASAPNAVKSALYVMLTSAEYQVIH